MAISPPVIRANVPTWISGYWLGRSAVCDFRLTVTGDEVRVAYPSNTGTYSSFYRGDWLGSLRSDYTAFQVTASDRASVVALRLSLLYVARDAGYRPGDACVGQPETRTLSVVLAVLSVPRP